MTKTVRRKIASQRAAFDRRMLEIVADEIGEQSRRMLDASLEGYQGYVSFNDIKAHPGKASMKTFMKVVRQLRYAREVDLGDMSAAQEAGENWRKKIARRVRQEDASEMRGHPGTLGLGMYAIWLDSRTGELSDLLVEQLVDTVHNMRKSAEKRVTKRESRHVERAVDERMLLKRILEIFLKHPDGTFRDFLYPMMPPEQIRQVPGGSTTPEVSWSEPVFETMRSSWQRTYRRMLEPILTVVEFQSNNQVHRPLLDALLWLRAHVGDGVGRIPAGTVPIEGVVAPKWRAAVVDGKGSVDRMGYELCAIMSLREQLRCKEIWVPGADKYRNPDEDLPEDFHEEKDRYYESLNLSRDARAFTLALRAEMEHELRAFNAGIVEDPLVRIKWTNRPRISITPLVPQAEPVALGQVRAELGRRFEMTSLLDMLKETALDTDLMDAFSTAAQRTTLPKDVLTRRLLLCLYGLGTNAGLARMAGAVDWVTYKELLRVWRSFMDPDGLREAARIVSNATLAIRDPNVWGPPGTACASDSKQFGAWDQNPLAEWHMRYGGRGVMIYWHVEGKSLCIYSGLKRVSTSEVASMTEGVLRHCTDAEVVRQYVDSHGQTEVAFAFCRLLGFDLAPRVKAITKQRLHLPDSRLTRELPEISPLLARESIDWEEI